MSVPDAATPDAAAPETPLLLATLLADPGRFSFDAAVDVLMALADRREAAEAIRFHVVPGMATALRDVVSVSREQPSRFRMSLGFSGLTGPEGVLPRPYTEAVNEEHRRRAPALGAFLDLLSQRPLAQFAMAGIKYHPVRQAMRATLERERRDTAPDPVRTVLLALTGHGFPADVWRSGLAEDQLLYFAGLFSVWPRSADRLAALLGAWLGCDVKVEQFVGMWLPMDESERSSLPRQGQPGQYNRLGIDTAIGTRVWDTQSRIGIVVGPLDRPGFEALLPDQPRLLQLARILQAYLDNEVTFSITLALQAAAVPPMILGDARLGWNSWLSQDRPRQSDVYDSVFAASGLDGNGHLPR